MKWPWCWKCWHRRNEHDRRGCRHPYWAGRGIGIAQCICSKPGTYGLAWEAERDERRD